LNEIEINYDYFFRNLDDEPLLASVIYFRAGYTPNDYPSDTEWNGRLLLEKSSAIKAPSIGIHLGGAKRVQQRLAEPQVLEQYVDHHRVLICCLIFISKIN
jgi:glutathione synthase